MSILLHGLPPNAPPISASIDVLPRSTAGSTAVINPKKRKRGEQTAHDGFQTPFTIRPYPASMYDKPRMFTPIQLLPRSKLPLSLLDPTASTSESGCTRLFSAHIAALEGNNGRKEEDVDLPMVLIAIAASDDSLLAVERVQNGVYALCKLANWVTLKVLQDLESLSPSESYWRHKTIPHPDRGHEYWQRAALGTLPLTKSTGTHPGCSRVSMARPAVATDAAPVPQPAEPPPAKSSGADGHSIVAVEPAAEQVSPQQTAGELFENLISQYLEALYLSKASLAYFAKGPISRARAAFTGNQDGSLQLSDLATFYRSMLLSTTLMDKKYKEKLPEIVRTIPITAFSDEEVALFAPVRSKKVKTKKLKPSKDGLYSVEAEYIKRWWLADWPSPSQRGPETAEQITKKRTADLKVRETMIQLIVAMEVMALELLPSCQQPQMLDDPGNTENQTQEPTEAAPQKKRKPKKLHDMSSIIDVLVERLCIWQSVEQEEPSEKLLNDGQSSENTQSGAVRVANSDSLKDFCVEVIIPFYVNRIPEKAASMNRKLGGPSALSPAKRTVSKGVSTSAALGKPGEPATRQPPTKKARQPLQKVSSEINPTTRRHPSLTRSATDSVIIPGLKREGSETPLMAIPSRESQTPRGGSLADIKRFKHREIDLNAMAVANEAKLRKKAAVESELKNAISALKKPNRGLAVKELADSADQRRLQRPGLPMRRSFNGVQVTATPKRASKTKDITQSIPAPRSLPEDMADELAPQSSGACIPSSAVRPPPSSFVPWSERRSSRSGLHAAVAETPSRGSAKTVSFFMDATGTNSSRNAVGGKLSFSSSGSAARSMAPPSKESDLADLSNRLPPQAGSSALIPQTPSKARTASAIFSTPGKPPTARHSTVAATPTSKKPDAVEAGAERSIYEDLGWDNDVDDLL